MPRGVAARRDPSTSSCRSPATCSPTPSSVRPPALFGRRSDLRPHDLQQRADRGSIADWMQRCVSRSRPRLPRPGGRQPDVRQRPTPNDGVKAGTCGGGTTPGSLRRRRHRRSFRARRSDGSATSGWCLPTGSSVGELALDLNPVTTGTTSVTASVECRAPPTPDNKCCPDQVAGTRASTASARRAAFAAGPIDGICGGQRFRFCRPEPGPRTARTSPGAGTCVSRGRASAGPSSGVARAAPTTRRSPRSSASPQHAPPRSTR